MVHTQYRWALIVENKRGREPRLDELLGELDQAGLDLVLVEGWKNSELPRIEVHRPELGRPLICRGDGPPAAFRFTQPALATTQTLVDEQPEIAAGAVRAIVKTLAALPRQFVVVLEQVRQQMEINPGKED